MGETEQVFNAREREAEGLRPTFKRGAIVTAAASSKLQGKEENEDVIEGFGQDMRKVDNSLVVLRKAFIVLMLRSREISF